MLWPCGLLRVVVVSWVRFRDGTFVCLSMTFIVWRWRVASPRDSKGLAIPAHSGVLVFIVLTVTVSLNSWQMVAAVYVSESPPGHLLGRSPSISRIERVSVQVGV